MWTHISYIIRQTPDARCQMPDRNVTAYRMLNAADINMSKCSNVQMFKCSNVQMFNVQGGWKGKGEEGGTLRETVKGLGEGAKGESEMWPHISALTFSKKAFFRSFGHIREAGNWPRAIPMDPFEIRVEGYTRYGRPRRSLFSLKSPYLWDSTPDICVHILSRNVSADRNVTAYICVHISKNEQIEVHWHILTLDCRYGKTERNVSADRNVNAYRMLNAADINMSKCSNVQMFKCLNVQMFKWSI